MGDNPTGGGCLTTDYPLLNTYIVNISDLPIALVTGATSGIGRVTAEALAKRGMHVVLLARDAAKAATARAEISAAAGHHHVDVLLADLADLSQVRRVAGEFNLRYPRLDVLVNNAGAVFGPEREVSADGYELGLATNYLGPFLLTSLLFERLQASPAARVVNVASTVYRMARPDWDDLQAERSYSALGAYANAKLFNIMFTQELARRLRAHGITNVTTNALHPGVISSGFGRGTSGWLPTVVSLMRPFLLTPEQGARTSIFLATDPSVAEVSGGYFDKQKAVPVKSGYNTPENARRLWEMTEKMTGTQFLD